jgi:ornithine cyclodeaminase/alanine dehydrogenase-like protein (mu-crystallin family)
MDARVVDGPEEALDEVSLIVTATTNGDPMLPEEVPEGVFIAAVGAFDPEMAELLRRGWWEAQAWW